MSVCDQSQCVGAPFTHKIKENYCFFPITDSVILVLQYGEAGVFLIRKGCRKTKENIKILKVTFVAI